MRQPARAGRKPQDGGNFKEASRQVGEMCEKDAAAGTDREAELVRQGLALDWPKYSGGAYRQLEPAGIRKKHWRAAAKQRGRLPESEM